MKMLMKNIFFLGLVVSLEETEVTAFGTNKIVDLRIGSVRFQR